MWKRVALGALGLIVVALAVLLLLGIREGARDPFHGVVVGDAERDDLPGNGEVHQFLRRQLPVAEERVAVQVHPAAASAWWPRPAHARPRTRRRATMRSATAS